MTGNDLCSADQLEHCVRITVWTSLNTTMPSWAERWGAVHVDLSTLQCHLEQKDEVQCMWTSLNSTMPSWAERWGAVHVDLSELYNAILSRKMRCSACGPLWTLQCHLEQKDEVQCMWTSLNTTMPSWAERWGAVHVDLSEHYNAILSRNRFSVCVGSFCLLASLVVFFFMSCDVYLCVTAVVHPFLLAMTACF